MELAGGKAKVNLGNEIVNPFISISSFKETKFLGLSAKSTQLHKSQFITKAYYRP